MKKLTTILLTAAVTAGLTLAVSAADPTILWDFGEDEEMSEYITGDTNVLFYGEEDYYSFMASGGDPYLTINTPADDVSDVQWAKVRVMNPSPATAIELFGYTNGRSLSGPECTHINIESNSDEWKTYIINVFQSNMITANTFKGASLDTTYWMGTVEGIRLDPMWINGDGDMTAGDEIYIDYVAFFSSEEDAKAFRADQDSPSDSVEQFFTEEEVKPQDVTIAETVDTSSPDPTIVWNFGSDGAMDALMSDTTSVEWEAADDYYTFTALNADPNVVINTPADDARLIQWAKVRVKNPGPATAIELFAATNFRSLSGSECTHIEVETSDEWKTYIVNLFDANVATANTYKGATLETTYWEGSVQSIRLDPMWQANEDGTDGGGSMNPGDQIMIDYIAFFANEDAAKAYEPGAETAAPETVEPENVETAVPAETAAPATNTTASSTAPQTPDAVVALVVLTGIFGIGAGVSKKRR